MREGGLVTLDFEDVIVDPKRSWLTHVILHFSGGANSGDRPFAATHCGLLFGTARLSKAPLATCIECVVRQISYAARQAELRRRMDAERR